MNLLDSLSKKYLYGTILVVVTAIVIVTVAQPANFLYKDKTDYASLQQKSVQERQEYAKLLASVNPDYQSSKQFLQKIVSTELVRQEVEQTLQTKQRIVVPVIAENELKISERNDASAVESYLNDFRSMATNYNRAIAVAANKVFASNLAGETDAAAALSGSATEALNAKNDTIKLASALRTLAVPKEALAIHKSHIIAYETYANFFDSAAKYAEGSVEESKTWPAIYNQYAVINSALADSNSELERLDKKFSLNLSRSEYAQDNAANIGTFLGLVPVAQAFLPAAIVIDIQRIAVDGIKTGLARAFAKFAISMLDKLVSHIEKNFAIASQLYYSNELGRFYSVEYMKKFVSNPLDQSIIQQFLPEYFCVPQNKDDLKKIFKAKAKENAGDDVVLNPNDPDFYQKLAKLGSDEKNYPSWWEDYYQTLAYQTKQQAEAAATKEVVSPGLKSGRDLATNQVNKTLSSILGVQQAAIAGTINLGTNNTENVVGQLIASTIENLVNKFVFTPIAGASSAGGTGASGGLGVLVEKNVCLTNPLIKPVAAVAGSDYDQVPTEAQPAN